MLASSVTFLFFAVIIYDHIYQPTITPERLLLTTGSIALVSNTVIFLGRQTLLSNHIGRRMALSLGVGSACFVLVGLAGLIHQIDGNTIMLMDTIIVVLSFANAYPAIQKSFYISFFALLMVFLSLYNPSWTHNAFLASGLVGVLVMVLDWRHEDYLSLTKDPPKS